jgi:hypothetical protein
VGQVGQLLDDDRDALPSRWTRPFTPFIRDDRMMRRCFSNVRGNTSDGDAGFILDCDKHHALGRTRTIPAIMMRRPSRVHPASAREIEANAGEFADAAQQRPNAGQPNGNPT